MLSNIQQLMWKNKMFGFVQKYRSFSFEERNEGCGLPNNEQNPEECDATTVDSSNVVGHIIKIT